MTPTPEERALRTVIEFDKLWKMPRKDRDALQVIFAREITEAVREAVERCAVCDNCKGYGIVNHSLASADEAIPEGVEFNENAGYWGGYLLNCGKCNGRGIVVRALIAKPPTRSKRTLRRSWPRRTPNWLD